MVFDLQGIYFPLQKGSNQGYGAEKQVLLIVQKSS